MGNQIWQNVHMSYLSYVYRNSLIFLLLADRHLAKTATWLTATWLTTTWLTATWLTAMVRHQADCQDVHIHVSPRV